MRRWHLPRKWNFIGFLLQKNSYCCILINLSQPKPSEPNVVATKPQETTAAMQSAWKKSICAVEEVVTNIPQSGITRNGFKDILLEILDYVQLVYVSVLASFGQLTYPN